MSGMVKWNIGKPVKDLPPTSKPLAGHSKYEEIFLAILMANGQWIPVKCANQEDAIKLRAGIREMGTRWGRQKALFPDKSQLDQLHGSAIEAVRIDNTVYARKSTKIWPFQVAP